MTVVVGLTDARGVLMGADTGEFYGLNVRQGAGKVFKNGEFLLGVSGLCRMADVLRDAALPQVAGELDQHMRLSFVDALRDRLREAGHAKKENNRETMDGALLVGVRGRLYQIDTSYHCAPVSGDVAAIGAGDAYALGNLLATAHLSAEIRLQSAIAAAEHYCSAVRSPYTWERLEAA